MMYIRRRVAKLIECFQKRLLNSTKKNDYFFAFTIGVAPILLSKILGIWEPEIINGVTYGGYKVHLNFHSHTFILPLSLFLLRGAGDKLFGVNVKNDNKNLNKLVPILTLFKNKNIKNEIHEKLKKIALDSKIFFLALFFDLIFHFFEKTLLSDDILKILFLVYNHAQEKAINYKYVCVYTFAHLGQFLIFFIAVTAILLLLFHNIFYLKLIYQKNRHLKKSSEGVSDYYYLNRHIVLDFDDIKHRFGLTSINEIFNIQLGVLFVAGAFSLFSRFSGVQPIDYKMIIPKSFAEKDLGYSLKYFWTQLYSPLGQYTVVALWVFTFCVVLLPILVKFLPFFSPQVISKGCSPDIESYLREFITDDKTHLLTSEKDIDILANKFARNAFWPTGDDSARWIFIFVFFILLLILFPLRLNLIHTIIYLGIIASIALFFAEVFLHFYRWILGHVDERLINRNNSNSTTINTDGGNYNEHIEGNYVQGNYYEKSHSQSLTQAVYEIQMLLKQLENTYPTTTSFEQMVVATEVVKCIEADLSLKQRVIKAVKEGGLTAFEKAIDNPSAPFIIEAIKSWK